MILSPSSPWTMGAWEMIQRGLPVSSEVYQYSAAVSLGRISNIQPSPLREGLIHMALWPDSIRALPAKAESGSRASRAARVASATKRGIRTFIGRLLKLEGSPCHGAAGGLEQARHTLDALCFMGWKRALAPWPKGVYAWEQGIDHSPSVGYGSAISWLSRP